MRAASGDLLVLLDSSPRRREAIERLLFVPPVRLVHRPSLPGAGDQKGSPLLYLVGEIQDLDAGRDLRDWLDRLHASNGAPVAFLLPRRGYEWCDLTRHPQCCGLLCDEPELRIEDLERVLSAARKQHAVRWGSVAARRAAFLWSFTARQVADPERTWLLVESALLGAVGLREDLSCLGIAFSEALTNSVEHGSLELDSSLKDDPRWGTDRFRFERERRLKDRRFALRRVRVTARVADREIRLRIRHRGRGFVPSSVLPETTGAESRPYGFGLRMMERMVDALYFSPDGREVTLVQQLKHPEFERRTTSARTPGQRRTRRSVA
jgi:anti-sigma regulatory factor (Ser/Thr protein kinase)